MRHVVAVSSCTAALQLALLALEVGPGDEVINPFTWPATATAIELTGERPVFCNAGSTIRDKRGHARVARALAQERRIGSRAVTLALLTTVRGAPEALAAFLDFHHAAGVDVVVVGGEVDPGAVAVLERHERDGFVRRILSSSQTDLARFATDELGVDWVLPAATDELWWPRGESLKDVLAVIPPRYGVVQGLVRAFLAADPRTVRTSLLGPDGSSGMSSKRLLRPAYRTGPNMTIDADDWTLGGRRVPLRAWYPIEVLVLPSDAPALDLVRVDAGLADGSLALDTRLEAALSDPGSVDFVVPSIVDDASYAVECAAVGEVDLVTFDRQIRDLELRIAELEARFWPRVRRTLRRLARPSS